MLVSVSFVAERVVEFAVAEAASKTSVGPVLVPVVVALDYFRARSVFWQSVGAFASTRQLQQ